MTPAIARALYVGLVTDTGMFMYENTDARTHRVAAGLIEAGVDVNGTSGGSTSACRRRS